MKNSLYIGKVYHKRHIPFEHAFTYRVFTLLLDIDDLPTLKFFSHNRFNLFSLFDKDHAKRDGSPIRPWIEKAAKEKNIDITGGKIFMLTFPRIFNYVFNPLTVYFCTNKNGDLTAILHQVKNTFGGQHGYLLPLNKNGETSEKSIKQSAEKIFHVSPFIHMDCEYRFSLQEPDDRLQFAIHQFETTGEQSKILTATWDGKREELTDKALLKTLLTHPFLTFKIIAGIHWEALKLFIKGAKYISPAPQSTNEPKKDVT